LLVEVVSVGVRGSRGRSDGRSCRFSLDGHGRKGSTFRFDSNAFQLDGLLKGFVEGSWLELEEFITECGTEVGDEQIECHVVECGVGTMFNQT
jgi:hypothetical protein